MMAELEEEMDRSEIANPSTATHAAQSNAPISHVSHNTKPSGGFLPPGAVPSQNGVLSKHAAEFWFPESRNCTCCNGFKHGCQCCRSGTNTCQHCLNGEPSSAALSHESNADHTKAAGHAGANPYSLQYIPAAVKGPSSARTPGTPEVCRFYSSPGGCRSGASCRFIHPTGDGSNSAANNGGGSVSSTPRDGVQACIYFQKGYCQFGSSCRFSHKT